MLTPDLIALDRRTDEILLVEVTICPDAALPRYAGRKAAKYATLCRQAGPAAPLRVLPPLVVAVGASGAIPASTEAALATLLLAATDEGSERAVDNALLSGVVEAAGAIARDRRPDAAAAVRRAKSGAAWRRGQTRRQRRLALSEERRGVDDDERRA